MKRVTMNREQLLLVKLAEECSEVAKVALKITQFGFSETAPNTSSTNAQRLREELDDLSAVLEMLKHNCDFSYEPNCTHIEDKKKKVEVYCKYSESLGNVVASDNIPNQSRIHPPDDVVFTMHEECKNKKCMCSMCGAISVCAPGNDFYHTKETGMFLICESCLSKQTQI